MGESAEPVIQILEAVGAGDAQAAEPLPALIYEESRRLAPARMAHAGHPLGMRMSAPQPHPLPLTNRHKSISTTRNTV